ncbi:glycosyltransferase family 9 protein [Aerosakkonemataceae cyanobacterium BLCC-F154]|uniref:Glycosyltransferase family 9 protein n=1 Tax=Floridaenema fluviatile BLCC-F154 TaxID=3153640 RepID=A0ABV4YGA3_9CYAN
MSEPFLPGLLFRLPETPRKIAIVRASRIGDFVCATPAFRAIRKALPLAEISLIAMPFLAELVKRSPQIDRFIPFPGFLGMAEQFFDPRKVVQFYQEMQGEQFDLAIQMHGSGVYSNPFTLMLGAKTTAGFIRPGDPAGKLAAALPISATQNEVKKVLSLVRFLGIEPQGETTEFPLGIEDLKAAEMLITTAKKPLIGLHPGAREVTKRWAVENFIGVGKALQREFGGTVVLLGGEEEIPTAELIAENIGQETLNLAGKTSLPELGGILTKLALLITNDSGPAHIAYALSTPSITIFGGTDPQVWGPLNTEMHKILLHKVSCHPCDRATCSVGYLCLEGTTVTQVFDIAKALIQKIPITGNKLKIKHP